MGNNLAKNTGFSLSDEQKVLQASFRSCGAQLQEISREALLQSWSNIIDPYLARCTVNFIHKSIPEPASTISFAQYIKPYSMAHKGTMEEKVNFIAESIELRVTNQDTIKALECYITAVFKSYLNLEIQRNTEAFKSWTRHGYHSPERTIRAFSQGLVHYFYQLHHDHINLDHLEEWLQINTIFLAIWREVFISLYYVNSEKIYISSFVPATNILPILDGLATGINHTPILNIPHVIYVNSNLPYALRNKWRFLFSSQIKGESFSTMLGNIVKRGPTLLVIEDEDRYVFAGYAPQSWRLHSGFFGDESSMLYTLNPEMRCFNSTGYNHHYQYLNLNQQTIPNGLGMGGQFHYWGLWIDSEYGVGQSSESCTTYRDYSQLSKHKDFRIRNMEVWGIGDEPVDEDSDDEANHRPSTTVLDNNMADKAFLQLAGKQLHSEGLREPSL